MFIVFHAVLTPTVLTYRTYPLSPDEDKNSDESCPDYESSYQHVPSLLVSFHSHRNNLAGQSFKLQLLLSEGNYIVTKSLILPVSFLFARHFANVTKHFQVSKV